MRRSKKYKNQVTPPATTPEDPRAWVKDYVSPVAVQRLKQDIARWRMAISEAETPSNPQRYLMQQMYLDTVLNGHVTACIEKRYSNVLKKGINVVNEKDEVNEDLTKLYSKRWMFDIIRYTLDARLYGYTLIQLGDMKDFDFQELYTIRRSNINPEKEIVMQSFYSESGISVYDPKYEKNLVWVKTQSEIGMVANWGKCGNGILYKIAPYEIWYRQAITLWNEYQQLFGMPLRIGKTKTRDERMRNQMSEMMSTMGAAGWAVVDIDDQIELADTGNMTGGNEVYLTMIDKLEKIISKVVLGHADALDSVPGKLGATQGEKSPAYLAMKDIEAFDCQFVEFELEKNIMPKLIGLGFPLPKGYSLKFVNSYEKMEARATEDINNKSTADMVKVLFDSGVKVDINWLSERTGIPLEEKPEPKPEVKIPTKNAVEERLYLQNKIEDLYGGCTHE
jgi:phage gp29-like protein